MSNLYKNKIGPAGLPIGLGSKGDELPVGIGSKGNTVQLPEDGNPFDKLAIKDLNKSTYDRLYDSIDDLDNRPGSYPDSLNTVNNISTDEIASLTEEKRTVEDRIAFLKEEIQRQRNLKDAEDSPLMEIALHRFKAYGDPSGLSDIANRQQTREMAEENRKYSKEIADLQKEEADAASMKDKENTLSRLNIIAKNAKDTLDNAKRSKGENSDEYRSALANYNLARYDVINEAKGLNDEEQVKRYSDAYPELSSVKSDPNTSEADILVNIVEKYRQLANDTSMSAFDRAKELTAKGKPDGMDATAWVNLKNEINDNLKKAFQAEKDNHNTYMWHVGNKKLFDELKTASPRRKREINAELEKRKAPKGNKYPDFKPVDKPTEPKYLK